MKGQMSECELHFIKARLRGGVLSKARCGELIVPLPVGLAYDAAVRGALEYLFTTFEATGSATAVVKAFRTAGLTFPWRHLKGPPQGRDRLETAGPPRRAAGTAQPPLRRRVHLWPPPAPGPARR